MQMIYSKKDPKLLIAIIYRLQSFSHGRKDIAPSGEFLQCAALEFNDGKTFKAHKHINLVKQTDITQEAWVVVQGIVKAMWFDLDDTPLEEHILEQGDLAMTFRGGHNYLIMEDETLVYEFKTGPYLGIELDKVFLDG